MDNMSSSLYELPRQRLQYTRPNQTPGEPNGAGTKVRNGLRK